MTPTDLRRNGLTASVVVAFVLAFVAHFVATVLCTSACAFCFDREGDPGLLDRICDWGRILSLPLRWIDPPGSLCIVSASLMLANSAIWALLPAGLVLMVQRWSAQRRKE